MNREGPDSLQSWIVACACCFVYMMQMGVNRLSGVMLVASMPRFNVNREVASFPYTLTNVVMNVTGPIVGCLGQKFGVMNVVALGGILSASGVGACYLARDITTVTVLWGIVYGIGLSSTICLLPVMINQHFEQKRATASGISLSGICLGSFGIPPIAQILIDNNGLSETYLIISGFLLACVPAALLLKKSVIHANTYLSIPGDKQKLVLDKAKMYSAIESCNSEAPIKIELNKPLSKECNSSTQIIISNVNKNDSEKNVYQLRNYKPNFDDAPESVLEENCIRYYKQQKCSYGSTVINVQDRNFLVEPHYNISEGTEQDTPQLSMRKTENIDAEYSKISDVHSNLKFKSSTNSKDHWRELPKELSYDSTQQVGNGEPECATSSSCCQTEALSSVREHTTEVDVEKIAENCYQRNRKGDKDCNNGHLMSSSVDNQYTSPKLNEIILQKSMAQHLSILWNPVFVIVAITISVYVFLTVSLITIIVDFSIDVGVEETNQKYILMSISGGELVGRLSLGWITDGRYMSKTGFIALSFMTQGCTSMAIGFATGFPMLMFMLALHGFLHSVVPMLYPLIVSDHIEDDKQMFTMSSCYFLSGPLTLCLSPLIGYCREELGSYTYIFFGMNIIAVLCGFLWLSIPYFTEGRQLKNRPK